MKKLLLKLPAFVCAAVYLGISGVYIVAMLTATTRNFNILHVIPALLGVVLFVVYGVKLDEKMPLEASVKVGLINLSVAFMPYILLALLLSPQILMTLPAQMWKQCILPLMLSVCPFAIAIWRKITQNP